MCEVLSGNRGEWSEIYVFLKLAHDGRIYAANSNMQKLDDTYLNIIRIIREEIIGKEYDYYPGDCLKIFNNELLCCVIPNDTLNKYKDIVWNMMNEKSGNCLSSEDVSKFLSSMYIKKLKAPAIKTTNFFGGTPDITLEVSDYKTNIVSVVGFSEKSAKATLFNASGDNTNFIFRVVGDINDEKMNAFNSIFKDINKSTGVKHSIATGERMQYLKDNNLSLEFVDNVSNTAKKNLIISGGIEMPLIIAELLKIYFFEGDGSYLLAPIISQMDLLVKNDPAKYKEMGFSNLYDTYKSKICKTLYDMFTGMRFGTEWNGRCDVNGGYIFVTEDGDVLAYHSCITDEFKDFLFSSVKLEGCDNSRHKSMQMYKDGDQYLIKFNLQLRFIK